MNGVRVVRRIWRRPVVRVDICRYDHDGMGFAHQCPALALQREIKARGYRVDRRYDTLFVFTTLKQYKRLFYSAQQRAQAKHRAWAQRAAVIDMWSGPKIIKTCKSEAEASRFIGTLPDALAGRYQIDVNGVAGR